VWGRCGVHDGGGGGGGVLKGKCSPYGKNLLNNDKIGFRKYSNTVVDR